MGITQYNFERMMKYIPTDSLCELGDQWLFVQGIPFHTFSRDFFSAEGRNHLINRYDSFDYVDRESVNVVIDLNKPIQDQESYDGTKYDVVTDFGTLEHVCNYYMGLKNAFELCKDDGILVISNPKVGSWAGHCFHYFTHEFFSKFCELTGNTLILLEEYPACGNIKDGWEVCAEIKKTSNKFPTKEEFERELGSFYISVFDEHAPARSQSGLTNEEQEEYVR